MVRRARIGAGISLALLLFAIATLIAVKVDTPGCGIDSNSGPLRFGAAPIFVVLVSVGAIMLDVLAIRAGGGAARWGRVGLLCLVAALVIGWFALATAADGLFTCTG
jgi:hypothetical protein